MQNKKQNQVKLVLTSILLLVTCLSFAQHTHQTFDTPESRRSDTINVLDYNVELNLTDSITNEISAEAVLELLSEIDDLTKINLDLLTLTVDSVWIDGNYWSNWRYNDTILSIKTNVKKKGEKVFVKVKYHGVPFGEQWGGWYNNSNYIFNLGVGFESIPHNLGKVWHPCVDNFIDRATYTVSLITFGNRIGVGSGILIKVDTLQKSPRILKRRWELDQEIPAYLYGIAAARYVELTDTFHGPISTVPSSLYMLLNQVSTIQTKTKHLEDAFKLYENRFGKYRWARVGYSTTSQGAMEHATNIAIPPSVPESTIMHELSHHWWGDLITCQSDRDMWINEGMAVFSEYLFAEEIYGSKQARENMQADLYTVLSTAHTQENGYHPISGVPRIHTYGTHTYRKGALVAHNLRVKLGDNKTFDGFKQFLDTYAFSDVSSYEFRDGMEKATGVNLTSFFDDWVFSPGMPCYTIDSFYITPTTGLYDVKISIKQLMANSDHFFDEMPLDVIFMDSQFNEYKTTILVSGEQSDMTIQIPINAIYASLNPDHELNYAMTSTQQMIKSNGAINGTGLEIGVTITSIKDSAYIRAQTFWTGPTITTQNAIKLGVRLNQNRYWRVAGVGETKFTLSGAYNAKKGQKDYGLLKYNEDSIIVLYRPNPSTEWSEYNAGLTIGLNTDSLGGFRIENATFGEYVLAERDTSINESLLDAVNQKDKLKAELFQLFPNPAKQLVTLNSSFKKLTQILIIDTRGQLIKTLEMHHSKTIDISEWNNGVYFFIALDQHQNPIEYKRLIKE